MSDVDEIVGLLNTPSEETQDTPEAVEVLAEDTPAVEVQPQDEAEQAPETEIEPAQTLKELAETSGIKLSDLYKVTVPTKDGGEPIPLGELKDLAQGARSLETDRTEFETGKTQWTTERSQALAQIRDLVKQLPPEALTPEAGKQMQALTQQHLAEEQGLLLEALPSWSDPVVLKAEAAVIGEGLSKYGISENEAQTITDHRLIRIFRDMFIRDAKIAELRTSKVEPIIKTRKPTSHVKQTDTTSKRVNKLAQSGDKIGAITELLTGSK